MDTEKLVARLEASAADNATQKAEIAAMTTKLTAAEAEVARLKTELEAANAKAEEAAKAPSAEEQAALKEKAEKAETELTAATEKLLPHIKAALVASGADEKQIPATLTAMVEKVEELGVKLHQVLGQPQADGGKSDVDDKAKAAELRRKEAFKLSSK